MTCDKCEWLDNQHVVFGRVRQISQLAGKTRAVLFGDAVAKGGVSVLPTGNRQRFIADREKA